jgi:hypothetical protein
VLPERETEAGSGGDNSTQNAAKCRAWAKLQISISLPP